MFKDNYSADTATLTPSKLLLTMDGNTVNAANVNEWAFNPPTVNEFTYINEENPFDNHSSLFDQKFNQLPPEPVMMPSLETNDNKQRPYPDSPPTPPSSADSPPKKQRKKLLEKNREAAYRCRQKKKRWVNDLETKSEHMEIKNKELQEQVAQLREESIYLRNLLLTHGNCDCDVVQTYLRRTSEKLSGQAPDLIGSTSSVSGSSESSISSVKQFYTNTSQQQSQQQQQSFMLQ